MLWLSIERIDASHPQGGQRRRLPCGRCIPRRQKLRNKGRRQHDLPLVHVGPWHYRDLIKLDNGAGTAGWGAQSIHRLLAGMPGADARPRQQVASQVLELLRALLRINDGDLSTTRSTLSSLWRAKLHIERNLTDDALDCESISRAVGLSARQLARAFEIDGISITRYIWAQRLERCRADLLDRNLRHTAISEIAFRWGFNDSAHFSRSYRSRFGETPTATRGMTIRVACRITRTFACFCSSRSMYRSRARDALNCVSATAMAVNNPNERTGEGIVANAFKRSTASMVIGFS